MLLITRIYIRFWKPRHRSSRFVESRPGHDIRYQMVACCLACLECWRSLPARQQVDESCVEWAARRSQVEGTVRRLRRHGAARLARRLRQTHRRRHREMGQGGPGGQHQGGVRAGPWPTFHKSRSANCGRSGFFAQSIISFWVPSLEPHPGGHDPWLEGRSISARRPCIAGICGQISCSRICLVADHVRRYPRCASASLLPSGPPRKGPKASTKTMFRRRFSKNVLVPWPETVTTGEAKEWSQPRSSPKVANP